MPYYAVKKGRTPGVYLTWDECKKQVDGFAGAIFKKFNRENEALDFVNGETFVFGVVGKGKSRKEKLANADTAGGYLTKQEDVIVIDPDAQLVDLYTDGACSGNPGKGGYGYAVVVNDVLSLKGSGGLLATTNNQMEIKAVIEGLKVIPENYSVVVHSDSSYVVNSFNKGWISEWRRRNWVKNSGQPVANRDFWEELLAVISYHPSVQFIWVKGHAGNQYNELCDRLAVSAIKQLK